MDKHLSTSCLSWSSFAEALGLLFLLEKVQRPSYCHLILLSKGAGILAFQRQTDRAFSKQKRIKLKLKFTHVLYSHLCLPFPK